jgi:hypothetical protein
MSSSYASGGSYESSRDYGSSGGYEQGRAYGGPYFGMGGYMRPPGYPPINLPPVKPYPPDPYIDQFPLPEALAAGTLFRWLYDPYVDPYRE